MKRIRPIVAVYLMMLTAGLYAQPQGGARSVPPKMKSPEEIAKKQAGMMKSEVGLTDKQYKKVYNLIKKDWQYRQSQAENRFGGMGGPGGGGMMGGGPGGMGGPGGGGMMGGGPGGMGGPGGGMMGGGPGGMGGGMPQGGDMQREPRPEGTPGMRPGEDIVTDEYLEKQDQKLKKILTDEQYSKWRAKHPAEHLDLPPLESAKPLKR